ncbi:hypothetical protein Clacol_003779 [Clathrus columnatus]|uniref:Uncharacterized protein n=1 Tax=Clathrus columnatus TaxID=1419009 RepID=A0AAV5A4H8_9AGAM|nr:hypothetical protein Clacol_003779 [Clathrus columnatus]
MSSPPTGKFEERTQQENWDVDPPEEELNVIQSGSKDNPVYQENGEPNRSNHDSEDTSGSLQQSKSTGGPEIGVPGAKSGPIYREKQVKPNKVYVGGLPEHTRQEDLQSCFGKIGRIVSIELKMGFGFEFADRGSAEESVAKYNEGYFMGNKIRVELSHGGSRSAKFAGDPGACFKCGQMGHWARECLNHVITVGDHRKSEASLVDRVTHPPRDILSRSHSPYRNDYRPQRDSRPRDYRPITPPLKDYRDYPVAPKPPRDSDDFRRDPRGSYTSRYDSRGGYYTDIEYTSRQSYPPPRDSYDSRPSYDKRPPPNDRYPPFPSSYDRSRTPPRIREDYDKPPIRDYHEYRGRPTTPRYPDNIRYRPFPDDVL